MYATELEGKVGRQEQTARGCSVVVMSCLSPTIRLCLSAPAMSRMGQAANQHIQQAFPYPVLLPAA